MRRRGRGGGEGPEPSAPLLAALLVADTSITFSKELQDQWSGQVDEMLSEDPSCPALP